MWSAEENVSCLFVGLIHPATRLTSYFEWKWCWSSIKASLAVRIRRYQFLRSEFRISRYIPGRLLDLADKSDLTGIPRFTSSVPNERRHKPPQEPFWILLSFLDASSCAWILSAERAFSVAGDRTAVESVTYLIGTPLQNLINLFSQGTEKV